MATNDDSLKLTPREIAAACESTGGPTVPAVLNLEEAAGFLRIPEGTLRDWRSRGLLTGCCRRAGKRVLFFRDRLLQKVFNDGLTKNEQ